MKYIQYYKENNIGKEEVFQQFISSLRSSIKIWDYFVNWQKVNDNLKGIEIELNILNSLIGKKDFKNEFISLIKKYPNVVKTFPSLLAVREIKLEIMKDYKKGDLSYLTFTFDKKDRISDNEAEKYYTFIEKSGLIDLFYDKKVKNFVDYVLGVEVGLDSNGRKNRGGSLMEEVVEVFIKKAINKNTDLEYMAQATPNKIQEKWNYEVKFEISARSFDFAIYNKKTKKLFLVETNFYNDGGSKLKSVCGEFKSLFNELQKQSIAFIWITDGNGWKKTKRPLEETFNNNDFVFNLALLEQGLLDKVL